MFRISDEEIEAEVRRGNDGGMGGNSMDLFSVQVGVGHYIDIIHILWTIYNDPEYEPYILEGTQANTHFLALKRYKPVIFVETEIRHAV